MINSYENMSVGKYLQIRALAKKEMEDVEMQVSVISILNDMSEDDVLNLPLEKYSAYARESNFLMNPPTPKAECPKKLVINGNKYYVMKDMKSCKTAQYIDYQTFMKEKDPDAKMAEILAIFIIPEGKTYGEGYDIADVVNEIKEHLPISVALNLCFFFRKKTAKSIRLTLIYLGLMMKIWKRKVKTEEQKKMMEEAERKMKELMSLYGDGAGFIV